MSYFPKDVYWAKVVFEDMPGYKIRPVLVLEESGDDVIIVTSLKMTSKPPRSNDPFDYAIADSDSVGLKKSTTVRTAKKLFLSSCDMKGRIGCISEEDWLNIQALLQNQN